MATFYIIYGFAEGPKVGQKLSSAMQVAGYTPAAAAEEADIIIAHSGGCFFVPKRSNASLYLLIGLPYWPGKPLAVSTAQKLTSDIEQYARENKLMEWLHKTAWNMFYMGGDGYWTAQLLAKRYKIPVPHYAEHATVLAVRNAKDPYFGHSAEEAILGRTNWQLVSMPGGHDDCWTNPSRYVKLLQKHIST